MRNTMTHVHIAFDKLRSLAIYYLVDEGFECPLHTLVRQGFFFYLWLNLKLLPVNCYVLTSFFFSLLLLFFFLVLLYPYNPSLSFSHTNSILHKPLISLSRCHFFFVFKIEECINIAFVFKFRQTSWKCIKQMNYNKRCNYSNIFVNVNSMVIIITIIQCLDTWCGQSCFSKSHDHWQN